MLLRLAKNGETVKKSLNQSFKYLKEATQTIKDRDDQIEFLEKTIEKLETY